MYFNKESIKKTITITLTQSCNLDCVYCYENHKSSEYMPVQTAIQIIDKEMSMVEKNHEIEIDLFGGEPFIKFESIKAIVEHIEENYSDYNLIVFITTNGTLLNEEIKDFCKKHCKILKLGLSYDGTKEMQNYNRSNSASLIDLDFFATVYPEQNVKMTVSRETLKNFADGVIYLHSYGFLISCNLAYGIDWSDKDNQHVLEKELMKLIDYYLEHPEIKPCSMLDDPISQIAYAEKQALRTCGAGWNMISYDVNGDSYPCQFFMPLAIGQQKAAQVRNLKFHNEVIPDSELDPKCIDCVIKAVCQRCYGSNYMVTGNMYYQDDNMCKMTKIIYKARAFFKSKLIENGCYNNCTEDELKMLMYSILLIDKKL